MAEINKRHEKAACDWTPDVPQLLVSKADIHPHDAYAQGYADREAEIVAHLRRRDRWGGGAIRDTETAREIEQGLDADWRDIHGK